MCDLLSSFSNIISYKIEGKDQLENATENYFIEMVFFKPMNCIVRIT